MTRGQSVRVAIMMTLILATGWTARGRKFSFTASNKVPAASGFADAGSDHHGNTEVDITVRSLANPGKLDPPANTYVVWFQHQDSPPENAGELKVSGTGRATLKTKTPWRDFEVFITAETDPHVIEPPLGPTVLQAKIHLK